MVVFLMSLLAFFSVITLSSKLKHIDPVSASNMVRMTGFYSMCILLLLPSIFTALGALNLSRMPVLTTKSAKAQYPLYPLYYKDNSHWNDLGAFIGYQEIAKRLKLEFKQVIVPEIKDLMLKEYIHGVGAGLSSMMVMSGEFPEIEVKLTIQPEISEKVAAPSLMIFQDSFFDGMKPYFDGYFQTVLPQGRAENIDRAKVEQEHPDVVLPSRETIIATTVSREITPCASRVQPSRIKSGTGSDFLDQPSRGG